MSSNVAQKLIEAHLMHGDMKPGEEIGIRIDQTQRSSREHAALGPQFLGLRAVVVKSFARIHART
jgi:hypothetical protein